MSRNVFLDSRQIISTCTLEYIGGDSRSVLVRAVGGTRVQNMRGFQFSFKKNDFSSHRLQCGSIEVISCFYRLPLSVGFTGPLAFKGN